MIRFIEVREEDITMGDQGCADSCAIALALRNEYGQDQYLDGMGTQFSFDLKGKSFSVDLWDEDIVKEFNK